MADLLGSWLHICLGHSSLWPPHRATLGLLRHTVGVCLTLAWPHLSCAEQNRDGRRQWAATLVTTNQLEVWQPVACQ